MKISNETRHRSRRLWGALGLLLAPATLCMALAGCGASSASASGVAAAPTPTCPPARTATATFKTVSGKITSVGTGSLTVAPASGASVSVQFTSTTRITKLAATTLSAVQVGQVAQVTPDTTGTIADRVTLQGASGFGRGAAGGGATGTPGATRTPGARINPACFRRTGQGVGGFGATAGQGGRVSQVSASQITLTDAQGQTLTYGLTSSTVVVAPTAATTADLAPEETVTLTGQAAGSGISARAIIITSTAP